MTDQRFTDRASLSGVRKTQDGYLVAEAFVAREGVQLYRGSEVGHPDRDVVRVYRPRDEVMAPASVRTYAHAPITVGHPDVFVTSDNWAQLAKGEVGDEAEWRDGKLRLPLILKDAEAIAAVEAGTRQLSAGYTCRLEFADGQTPGGEAFDAIQRDIRINHVAIVPAGRAGADCRIGDDAAPWGASPVHQSDHKEDPMSDPLKTVVLGDKAVQVAAADASTIDAFKADQARRLSDAQAAHDKVVAAKDAEIARLEGERDGALAKVLSDADLDARVAARAELVARAKAIAPTVDTKGLSDAAIRKAVVVARLGDAVVAGKSEAYVDARFDTLVEDAAKTDPVAGAIAGVTQPVGDARAEAVKARAAHATRLADGWKQPVAAH